MLGVPWFNGMFAMEMTLREKENVLKNAILNTFGVNNLINFEFGLDPINKGASVEFEADTIYGIIEGGI